LHRLGVRLFYLVAASRKLPIEQNATHFRVLSREIVNAITRIRSPKRYLRTLTHAVGFGAEAVPYELRFRRARRERRSLATMVHLAFDIVVTNTTWPLRAASNLAILASMLSMLFLAYTVVAAVVTSQ